MIAPAPNRITGFAGRTIHLDLPEMGAAGPAVITDVRPCPPIEPEDGSGRRVVTGRFIHAADGGLLNLLVEGEPAPTGVTSNHPYWSVTRQQFVEAGQLEVGEQIDTLTGPRKIAALTLRARPETVYNLEVHGEHVYRVGALGTLVHNSYVNRAPFQNVPDMRVSGLPRLDGTGKVHGILPSSTSLHRYTRDELELFRSDLIESVKERIVKNSEFGPMGNHGLRQMQEQDLIHDINRIFSELDD